MAIVHQIPIVGFEWITQCQDYGKIISFSEYQYHIQRDMDQEHPPFKTLFSQFNFIFPHIRQFNNYNLNKSRISAEHLKIMIQQCGGNILHNNYYQLPDEKQQEIESSNNRKTLVHVKCDESFQRLEADMKLALYKSQMKQ